MTTILDDFEGVEEAPIDYRKKENRWNFFEQLYKMNLTQGVMPGLVYLYMPELARRLQWNAEDRLWFAFLNGLTQNPITTLQIFKRLPHVPKASDDLSSFSDWFNEKWEELQFDTDRRYQKKESVQSIKVYSGLVEEYGTQENMLSNRPYEELWKLVYNRYFSFGRLSSFSYLEYVHLNGFGADCTDLMFGDKSGSKSHRNGMLLLTGQDDLVDDKRMKNNFPGYSDFSGMVNSLEAKASEFLKEYKNENPGVPNVGNFTMESNLCTFKNHFFGRRYPGVYADMAFERIERAEARGIDCEIFKDMRAELLPSWLRCESERTRFTIEHKASIFPASGVPYRANHFIK